ncbi:MAG: hypothetical protein J7L54_05545, partial [Elusimicrobia bacterium]|nr:hypothetical protein [Elusimicrobiota bacterium]
VKTSILIDKDLWEKFKEIALKKHNFQYGAISEELEKIIKDYIDAHTNTQNEITKITSQRNPPDKVYTVWQQVKSILHSKGEIREARLQTLREAISKVRGVDERTITKWIRLFLKYGFVKDLGNNVFEIN